MEGREGGGERETTRTGRDIGRRRAGEIQSRCRSGPASGYNQKSYSVSVAFGFLFVKPEPPSLTSVTDVLPQNRVRLFFALGAGSGAGSVGRAGRGRPGRRGQGRGAQRPSQPGGLWGRARPPGGQSASRSLPHGRAPRGRGKAGWRDVGGGRGGGGGKVQPAGLGRIAPRRVGRRRGWAASENWEEGRILEAQDKQIVPLHVRGGGRWRGWGAGAVASPLPLPLAGSLSRSAGRSAGRKPAAAPAPPPAPRTPRPGMCAISKRRTEGPPAPGPAPPIEGRSAKATGDRARPRLAPGFP